MVTSEAVWRWVGEVDNWLGIGVFTALCLAVGYIYYLKQPRTVERAMARTKEKQGLAELLLPQLERAVTLDIIPASRLQHYQKKLGQGLDLPDLIPAKKPQLIWNGKYWLSIPTANLAATKAAVLKRLQAMGIKNMVQKLDNIATWRSQTTKKKELLASLKSKR